MSKTCWLGGLALTLWAAVAMAQPQPGLPDLRPPDVRKRLLEQQMLINDALPIDQVVVSEYWLGIECLPVSAALRAQLNLPEKQGLLVERVAPDSPAARAGLARHDVLLRAGDKSLAEPGDLIQSINKKAKLKIELIRGGRPMTAEATPTKRPEEARRAVAPGADDWETMQKWMERMMPDQNRDGGQPPMHFRIWHPGAILPHDAAAPEPLPPNVSVVISKEGDQPAKIVVKRGDEKWEATEKDLEKLPADIRPHVERMLGRGPLGVVGGPSFDFVPEVASPGGRGEAPAPGLETKPSRGLLERMEQRFDEMNRRMDRLLREVEDLGEGPSHPKAPEQPAPK